MWQKDFEGVIEITKSADSEFIEREIIWVGLASSHESFQSGCRNKCEGPLEGATWTGAVGGLWPIASEKMGASVPQLQETEFCSQPVSSKEAPELQKGTQPYQHHNFSL